MNRLAWLVDRLRLAVDLWLYRQGLWWPLLFAAVLLLVALAAIAIPGRQAELSGRQDALSELRARAADQREPSAIPEVTSEANYQALRAALAGESEVLPAIEAILDAAESHHLMTTRADYLRARDAPAQAANLQMTIPVRGRYADVRDWIEEILARHTYVAVNELGFKREEIGLDQIEARVRVTIWYDPARSVSRAGDLQSLEVDP